MKVAKKIFRFSHAAYMAVLLTGAAMPAMAQHGAGPSRHGYADADKPEPQPYVYKAAPKCMETIKDFNDFSKSVQTEVWKEYNFYKPNMKPGTMERFLRSTDKILTARKAERMDDYNKQMCVYSAVVVCPAGISHEESIESMKGFAFEPQTLVRTMNTDWAGGPYYSTDNSKLSWTTGGRHGGKTAVTINARYTDEQVKAFVNGEMENIVAHLNDDMNVEIPMP